MCVETPAVLFSEALKEVHLAKQNRGRQRAQPVRSRRESQL